MIKPPGNVVQASAPGGGDVTFLVRAPRGLLGRLEAKRAQLGLRDRNATVVRLLDEGCR